MEIVIFKGEDHYEVERNYKKWARDMKNISVHHINTTFDTKNHIYITIGYDIKDK